MEAVLAIALLLTLDPAIVSGVHAGYSGDQERAAYAAARFHDPAERTDRDLLDPLYRDANGSVRAAVLRGLCDRTFADPPADLAEHVNGALGDVDGSVRLAAAECADRLPDAARASLLDDRLEQAGALGADPGIALLLAAAERGEASRADAAKFAARRLAGIDLETAAPPKTIDGPKARALAALAEFGLDVEPLLKTSKTDADFWRTARVNRIRAGRGEAIALSALVASAREAIDAELRRECVVLATSLPPEERLKALVGLADRLGDGNARVRMPLVRALSRDAVTGDARIEKELVTAASDPLPELRLQAIAGLYDRAIAGKLASGRGALAGARDAEKDPLVTAAWGALWSRLPVEEATPTPEPKASPAPAPTDENSIELDDP